MYSTVFYNEDKEKSFIPKYEDYLEYLGEKEALIMYNIADTFHYSSIRDENKLVVLEPTVISIFLKDENGNRFTISFMSQKYDGLIAYIEGIASNKVFDNRYQLLDFLGHDDHSNRKLILNTENEDVTKFFELINKYISLDEMVKWSKSIKPKYE